MKAQGLPITTIVLIVLAVVSLVVILLFFFGVFQQGKSTTQEQGDFAKCNAICTKIIAYSPKTQGEVINLASKFDYCKLSCNKYIVCNVESVSCTITCAGTAPACS